jgi:hypothetical protein
MNPDRFPPPGRILTEAQAHALLERIPRPVPREYQTAYRRLYNVCRTRGWAWPYNNYVAPSRRVMPIAPNPKGYY